MQNGLNKSRFDGCMYGLVSCRPGCVGMKLKQPWTVVTNSVEIPKVLNVVCDKSHYHVHVMAQDTKKTEEYTNDIADAIHTAWTKEFSAQV